MNARRWVAAAGIAAIAVAFVAILFTSVPRRSGTDLTPNGAFVAGIRAGAQTCQGGELLPADTAAVQMTIGTYGAPGPPIAVTFTSETGLPVASGRLAGGWKQGIVRIPITPTRQATTNVRVCLRNEAARGTRGQIALAGDLPDPGYTMNVAGRSVPGRLRYDYLRPGSESWWELLPTIVHRFSLGKSDAVRHWAWAGVLILMLVAVVLALRTVLAETARSDRERAS